MSHFTVLVISKTEADVPRLLAPYQENNMGDCPPEFLQFHDTEDENRNEYETETVQRVKLEDGTLVSPYVDRFKKPNAGIFDRIEAPATMPRIDIPKKELWPTFEAYMDEYCGSPERDPKTNRYGYWENPNRKWDWFSIGGRWSGMLQVKPGKPGTVGEPGVMGSRYSDTGVDQCRAGDLDLQAMLAAARDRRCKAWDKAEAEFKQKARNKGWDVGFGDTLVRFQHALERLRAIKSEKPLYALIDEDEGASMLRDLVGDADFMYGIEPGTKSRDHLIASTTAITTHAVLTEDGKWYERGQMSWWAVVINEKDEDKWNAEFQKLLESTPADRVLTLVDCHI